LFLCLFSFFVFSYQGSCASSGSEAGTLDIESMDDEEVLRFARPRAFGGFRQNLGNVGRGFAKNIRGIGANVRGNFRALRQNAKRINPWAKTIKNAQQGINANIRGTMNQFNQNVGRFRKGVQNGIQHLTDNLKRAAGKNAGKIGKFEGQAGKVEVVSADEQFAKSLCLDKYFYCYIDCPSLLQGRTNRPGNSRSDIAVECKVANAQIYNIAVPKEDHQKLCVDPRLRAGEKNGPDCYLRPCQCKTFEAQLYAKYQGDYNKALTMIEGQCHEWCTTGNKPSGVWDKQDFAKKQSKMKKFWKGVGKVLGAPFKAIGKAFKAVGKALKRIFKRF